MPCSRLKPWRKSAVRLVYDITPTRYNTGAPSAQCRPSVERSCSVPTMGHDTQNQNKIFSTGTRGVPSRVSIPRTEMFSALEV